MKNKPEFSWFRLQQYQQLKADMKPIEDPSLAWKDLKHTIERSKLPSWSVPADMLQGDLIVFDNFSLAREAVFNFVFNICDDDCD